MCVCFRSAHAGRFIQVIRIKKKVSWRFGLIGCGGLGSTFLSEAVGVGAEQRGILVHFQSALMRCDLCCAFVILNMLLAYLRRELELLKTPDVIGYQSRVSSHP